MGETTDIVHNFRENLQIYKFILGGCEYEY